MLPSESIWPASIGAVLAFALAVWVRLRRWSRATEHTATDPRLAAIAVALRHAFWHQATHAAAMALLFRDIGATDRARRMRVLDMW